ncbi:MAG: sugar phosphate nucleotidyltransferase [Firmicutes bacterium]|nr:sugar phosphate nucleotidyltransferase [Bacillota bacterium]MCL5780624.1 sugar phosphate nucleotidyltransferase [Bacillota bacterium]
MKAIILAGGTGTRLWPLVFVFDGNLGSGFFVEKLQESLIKM